MAEDGAATAAALATFAVRLLQHLGPRGVELWEQAVRRHDPHGCDGGAFAADALDVLDVAATLPDAACYPWQRRCLMQGPTAEFESPPVMQGFLPLHALAHGGLSFLEATRGTSELTTGAARIVHREAAAAAAAGVDRAVSPTRDLAGPPPLTPCSAMSDTLRLQATVTSVASFAGAALAAGDPFATPALLRRSLSALHLALDPHLHDAVRWEDICCYYADVLHRGGLVSQGWQGPLPEYTRVVARRVDTSVDHVHVALRVAMEEDETRVVAAHLAELERLRELGPIAEAGYGALLRPRDMLLPVAPRPDGLEPAAEVALDPDVHGRPKRALPRKAEPPPEAHDVSSIGVQRTGTAVIDCAVSTEEADRVFVHTTSGALLGVGAMYSDTWRVFSASSAAFGSATAMAYMAGPRVLAVATSDCKVRLYLDPEESAVTAGGGADTAGVLIATFPFGTPQAAMAELPPGSGRLVLGSQSGLLSHIIVPQDAAAVYHGTVVGVFSSSNAAPVGSLGFVSGLNLVAAGCSDGVVRLFDGDSGNSASLGNVMSHTASVAALDTHRSLNLLAAASGHDVFIWPTAEGTAARAVPRLLGDRCAGSRHRSAVTSVSFCPWVPQLLSGDASGVVKAWDLRTMACVATVRTAGTVLVAHQREPDIPHGPQRRPDGSLRSAPSPDAAYFICVGAVSMERYKAEASAAARHVEMGAARAVRRLCGAAGGSDGLPLLGVATAGGEPPRLVWSGPEVPDSPGTTTAAACAQLRAWTAVECGEGQLRAALPDGAHGIPPLVAAVSITGGPDGALHWAGRFTPAGEVPAIEGVAGEEAAAAVQRARERATASAPLHEAHFTVPGVGEIRRVAVVRVECLDDPDAEEVSATWAVAFVRDPRAAAAAALAVSRAQKEAAARAADRKVIAAAERRLRGSVSADPPCSSDPDPDDADHGAPPEDSGPQSAVGGIPGDGSVYVPVVVGGTEGAALVVLKLQYYGAEGGAAFDATLSAVRPMDTALEGALGHNPEAVCCASLFSPTSGALAVATGLHSNVARWVVIRDAVAAVVPSRSAAARGVTPQATLDAAALQTTSVRSMPDTAALRHLVLARAHSMAVAVDTAGGLTFLALPLHAPHLRPVALARTVVAGEDPDTAQPGDVSGGAFLSRHAVLVVAAGARLLYFDCRRLCRRAFPGGWSERHLGNVPLVGTSTLRLTAAATDAPSRPALQSTSPRRAVSPCPSVSSSRPVSPEARPASPAVSLSPSRSPRALGGPRSPSLALQPAALRLGRPRPKTAAAPLRDVPPVPVVCREVALPGPATALLLDPDAALLVVATADGYVQCRTLAGAEVGPAVAAETAGCALPLAPVPDDFECLDGDDPPLSHRGHRRVLSPVGSLRFMGHRHRSAQRQRREPSAPRIDLSPLRAQLEAAAVPSASEASSPRSPRTARLPNDGRRPQCFAEGAVRRVRVSGYDTRQGVDEGQLALLVGEMEEMRRPGLGPRPATPRLEGAGPGRDPLGLDDPSLRDIPPHEQPGDDLTAALGGRLARRVRDRASHSAARRWAMDNESRRTRRPAPEANVASDRLLPTSHPAAKAQAAAEGIVAAIGGALALQDKPPDLDHAAVHPPAQRDPLYVARRLGIGAHAPPRPVAECSPVLAPPQPRVGALATPLQRSVLVLSALDATLEVRREEEHDARVEAVLRRPSGDVADTAQRCLESGSRIPRRRVLTPPLSRRVLSDLKGRRGPSADSLRQWRSEAFAPELSPVPSRSTPGPRPGTPSRPPSALSHVGRPPSASTMGSAASTQRTPGRRPLSAAAHELLRSPALRSRALR